MEKSIWEQKADSKTSSHIRIVQFLYALFDVRFTVVMLLSIVTAANPSLKYYGYILLLFQSYLFYHILKEAFDKAWYRYNLVQGFTSEGIYFNWGKSENAGLLIPFSEIDQVILVNDNEEKHQNILFKSVRKNYSKTHYFLTDESTTLLKFDKVKDHEKVYQLLLEQKAKHKLATVVSQTKKPIIPKKLVKQLTLGFSFILILAGSYTCGTVLDFCFSDTIKIEDTVINQSFKATNGNTVKVTRLFTSQGYSFPAKYHTDYKNINVTLDVSSVFKQVKYFKIDKATSKVHLNQEFSGINLASKIFFFIIALFAGCYIIYRHGDVPPADMTFVIIFPLLLYVCAYWIFSI